MNRVVISTLVASSVVGALWASPVRAEDAQDLPEEYADTPQHHAAPPPARQQQSSAPQVIVTPAPQRDTVTIEEKTPNAGLIGSGLMMFGLSYGGAVIVGAASSRESDQKLFMPVVGPWMNLANRGTCSAPGCDANETANRVLLVADGVFQAAGVLQILGGFLFPEKRIETRAAGVQVAPSVGLGSFGVTARGAF